MARFGRSAQCVLLLVSACLACTDSHRGIPDASVKSDASAPAHASDVQATARATLVAVPAASTNTPAPSGSGTFVATSSGVDLTIAMRGCVGASPHPVRILEALACDGVRAESPAWGARGEGI